MKAYHLLPALTADHRHRLAHLPVTPLFLWWLSRSAIFKLLIAPQPQPLTSAQLDVLYTAWVKCVRDMAPKKKQPPKPKENK